MQFGAAVGTACSSFAITNIDDIFVLVTFFAESSTNKSMTPLLITIGQYLGFTVIMVVSMIGFGVSLVLPSEPIGFLGLLPVLLGVWKFFGLVFPKREPDTEEQPTSSRSTRIRNVAQVALITIMNGGDNIGTYIPLFSQTKGAEIAIYVVIYYILLGVWCLIAFLVMKQKHILSVAQKYAGFVIPFLYLGLGIFIIIKSSCYPWSIEEIDEAFYANPGTVVMAVTTTGLLLVCTGAIIWYRYRQRAAASVHDSDREMPEISVQNTNSAPPTCDCQERTGAGKQGPDGEHPECAECGNGEVNLDSTMERDRPTQIG